MNSVTAHITLDRIQGHYCPGDVVTGLVHLELHKTIRTRYIRLHVRGRELVYMSDGVQSGTVADKRRFLDHGCTIWKSSTLLGEQLTMGSHRFPFSISLPTATKAKPLPPACEDFYANVRYKLTAILEAPLGSGVRELTCGSVALPFQTIAATATDMRMAPVDLRTQLLIPVDPPQDGTSPGLPISAGIRVSISRQLVYAGERIRSTVAFLGDIGSLTKQGREQLSARCTVRAELRQHRQYTPKT
ncbi:hypothetical protein THASP1DRAFT_33702 [Thamnocephalis sphaerospora]|uniref:Arrestin-like N-terminal domain-containing protein n=1 Tax=Thamnocephalis sphaerospora TaxID=78915 RepID=A0A4P9XFZ8_9FUNG|nr:hypothetical protein THASP1DRAFT_33702 [Thamnocephalis sphaerospora]|eukprot:RKP04524.1 hypothetical protein THASP1DRAFT_33702 [Thamnocephalis sphaerospora]